MSRSVQLVCAELRLAGPTHVSVVLDRPVSHSGELAGMLRDALEADFAGRCRVSLEDSADGALRRSGCEFIASADSAVIDAADKPVFDLARMTLVHSFGAEFPSAGDLVRDRS